MKYEVPSSLVQKTVSRVLQDTGPTGVTLDVYLRILNGFVKVLAENPIKPTLEQIKQIGRLLDGSKDKHVIAVDLAVEWQRLMFLLPGPMCRHCGKSAASPAVDDDLCVPCWNTKPEWEIPEAVRDLMGVNCDYNGGIKKAILEAYRRGREGM